MTGKPPLSGVRILDLSRVLAGPFCSMVLADLGAEVIKVEMPGTGDDTRTYPPLVNGESVYFMSINRSKKSVTLDLKSPEGQEALHRLASKSDVILENFRPGVTARLAADYDTMRKLNPRLVYCSISSFGQTGPYAEKPGYDLIVQGMGGLMGITGEPDGPPMKVGIAITDMGAGMWAAIAILAALSARERDGKGQYLDVSMMDGSVAWMTYLAATYLSTGKVPPRLGNAHQSIVPYQSFEAGDGKSILIAGGNDRLFQSLCDALGLPDLPKDPRYKGNGDRVKNRDTLLPQITARFKTKPRDEWIRLLEAEDFPVAPVYSMDEIFADSQVKHRSLVREVDHPKAGEVRLVGPPLRLSETPCWEGSPPPVLGEHTEEVLTRLAGYSKAEVDAMRGKGIV